MAGPSDRRTDRRASGDPSTGRRADRERERATSRRRLLAAGGAVAAAAIAGCSDYLPDGMASFDGPGAADTPTASPDPTAPDTDVVSLQYRRDGSTYEFIVGLEPPEGTGGADWWQVETLDGERLARKAFDEPRTDGRVTTSSTVEIDDPGGVVVRGHDVDAGYGGQVMLADLASGEPPVVEEQGREPTSFADYSF